jgi:peptidoglycan/LPS O-acetylase OafA/YrhL
VPTARPLTSGLRALLAGFAGLALIAGFLLFPLAEETDRFFSWTIQPPLTAAFLGAGYWAAFILIGWSASRPTWEEVVPALVPVTVIAVLLLAATLIHLDKFDLDSLFGWFWLAVYCAVPVALAFLIRRQLAVPPQAGGPGATPVPALLRVTLGAQALIMVAMGIVLWVSPSSADTIWPWPLTPLTARAVGAFLIGFAAAAAFAALDNRVERLRGAAYAYATLGALELLAALIFGDDFDDGESAVYVSFAVSVLLVGLAGSATVRGLQRG